MPWVGARIWDQAGTRQKPFLVPRQRLRCFLDHLLERKKKKKNFAPLPPVLRLPSPSVATSVCRMPECGLAVAAPVCLECLN